MEGMLGGIIGLVGAGLQAQAQHDQLMFQYAQFNWQKQRADTQDRFAQAARKDMYGNKTAYDRATNEWGVTLTPDQKEIMDAQEKEQLLQLTKDAPAARKIKQAVQQRAEMAKEPFNRAQLGYQYDQPKSEAAIRSELTGLLATNDMIRSKADQALIMRQALRAGGSGHPQEIIQVTDQQLGNPETTKNRMLQARQMAMDEYSKRQQQHEVQWGTPMKVWGDLMSQGGDLPNISKGNVDSGINSMINSQMQGMMSAYNQGTNGVSSAMTALANAAGKSPDLSAAASAFGKMKFGGSKKSEDDTYDPTTNAMGLSSYGQSGFDDRGSEGW